MGCMTPKDGTHRTSRRYYGLVSGYIGGVLVMGVHVPLDPQIT